ncbi:Kelch repeat-containing protein [Belliella pelovolcani]|uniref:IPT/TIG domain-containing protein n=1 Tax=Belliella pelovolcani TaxID=529505 RepID=A0A1N7NY52_9BACT|nr:hypothetical protein [Belliella pelovolcani]SIT03250.1 hypothetical protein SAMN05421761_11282 [Belliella pelovolcani]
MKKFFNILLLIVFLSSCEEEKLPELVNPRFSVAYIQEIDENGVTFAANIYDIGKKEILEYGFFYSPKSFDPVNSGEKISSTGQPEGFFELTANYSMVAGREYHVVAFIRTESGLIVSNPQSFISQGSTGFIFEKIELPDHVYYFDTIKIFGKNLTQKIDQIRLRINNSESTIVSLNQEFFEAIVPNTAYEFGGNATFNLTVSEKQLTLILPFSLTEPEFELHADFEQKLSEPLVIKGKYLRNITSPFTDFIQGTNEEFNINATTTDSTITFEPRAIFNSNTPSFKIKIRGKEYVINNSVKLAPKIFEPNQIIQVWPRNKVKIKGSNFNTYGSQFNKLSLDNEAVKFHIYEVTENEMVIDFYSDNFFIDQDLKFTVFSHGELSKNTVQVGISDPRSIYMDLNMDLARKFRSIGNKVYYIDNGQINEIDLNTKSQSIKADIPYEYFPLENPEIFLEHMGSLYFSDSYNSEEGNINNFYKYDPVTNVVTSLPLIQSDPFLQKWVFAYGDYIYLGGGEYIQGPSDFTINYHTYKFNIHSLSWQRIPPSNYPANFGLYTFTHNNEIYGMQGSNPQSNNTSLYKFNLSTNQWVKLKTFETYAIINQSSPNTTIGDKTFISSNDNLYSLDMNSLSLEKVILQGFSYLDSFRQGTVIDNYYYYPLKVNGKMKLVKFNPLK